MLWFNLRWWILSKGLAKLAQNPHYKVLLNNKHEVIQFKTADGKFSRYFKIAQGTIFSKSGTHRYATLTIQINDSKYLNAAMVPDSNLRHLIKGLQFGEINACGDVALLFWFFELIYTEPMQNWLKLFNWTADLQY